MCVASCRFFLFIRGIAHLDGLFTLSTSLLSTSCACFSVSFHVDWLLFLHPSVLLPCLFSHPPVLLFLYVHFIGRAASLFWLVSCCIWCLLIGSPLVMWCALDWLCVFCVWTLSNDDGLFCLVFNRWNCCLIHLLFPSFFKVNINQYNGLGFLFECFCSEVFSRFLCSVCQWLHCLCAKLPDYSPGSLFMLYFSFKWSACIRYHRCSSTGLTSVK